MLQRRSNVLHRGMMAGSAAAKSRLSAPEKLPRAAVKPEPRAGPATCHLLAVLGPRRVEEGYIKWSGSGRFGKI